MGDSLYRTTPRLIEPTATIRLDDDVTLIHAAVTGYVYAYKPYWESRLNKRMQARYVAPAERAFDKANISVPRYGVHIASERKTKTPIIGDRVFKTSHCVSMMDYGFITVGVIINLDETNEDQRTLAQILDPAHYGTFRVTLANYIGNVLFHDYGYGKSFSGITMEEIAEWKAKLDPDHRSLFEQLERAVAKTATHI